MISPTYQEVLKLKDQGNVIAVTKPVMADFLTPVSAFVKVAATSEHAFLLESIEGGEKIARYSFIGWEPFLVVRSKKSGVELRVKQNTPTVSENVFDVLKNLLNKYKLAPTPGLPPFTGGGVGYFAYDVVKLFETIPDRAQDDLALDDVAIMFFSHILAFDHLKHQIIIISNIFLDDDERTLREKYDAALNEITHVEHLLSNPIPAAADAAKEAMARPNPSLESNLTEDQFKAMVVKAKEYIKAGDIFQVVLSQRFHMETTLDPFNIYRALRVVNPSPYMFYLKMGKIFITGASPEMLVKVVGDRIEYRPIAGTRRRGATEAEDAALVEELRHDEKEIAEHVMLVDLGRNDLGRVSEYGSVHVKELMLVEKYSHVMHLVSSLQGTLRRDLAPFDAFISCFPAGTVSGAPKVRAMEIIEALEPTKRGVYAGAIAYMDFSGNFDSCIALRTLLFNGQRAFIQVGAGIVADSTPEGEYQETVNKAMALIRAVELAANNFEL